jgi:hypothetical protein
MVIDASDGSYLPDVRALAALLNYLTNLSEEILYVLSCTFQSAI